MDKEEIIQMPPALDLPQGNFGRYPHEPPRPHSGTGESKPIKAPPVERDPGRADDVIMS